MLPPASLLLLGCALAAAPGRHRRAACPDWQYRDSGVGDCKVLQCYMYINIYYNHSTHTNMSLPPYMFKPLPCRIWPCARLGLMEENISLSQQPAMATWVVSSISFVSCVVCRVRVCRVPFSSLPATISTLHLSNKLSSVVHLCIFQRNTYPTMSARKLSKCRAMWVCLLLLFPSSLRRSYPIHLRFPPPNPSFIDPFPSLQHRSTVVCEVPTPLQMWCSF